MKKVVSVILILIFAKHSYALDCYSCDTSINGDCGELQECDKGVNYCETLVSKVNGNYTLVLSCGSEDKCEAESEMSEDGLDGCKHNKENTECFTCCDSGKCNKLKTALKNLPDDIEFDNPPKSDKKSKSKKEDPETEEDPEKTDEEETEDVDESDEEKKSKKSKDNDEDTEEEEPIDTEDVVDEDKEPEESIEQTDAIANADNATVVGQTSLDNQTVVATNLTEESTGNNIETVEGIQSVDPNIQIIEDTFENAENGGLQPQIIDATPVEASVPIEQSAPQDTLNNLDSGNEASPEIVESNIMTEGENADEPGNPNELVDVPSSSTKYQISEIFLAATSILILIQFI